MRKIIAIYIGVALFVLCVILNSKNIVQEEFRSITIIVPVLWVFVIGKIDYFREQPFGYSMWVNPILKLSILLIKLDGVERISETKRIIKYLNEFFDPVTVKYKLRFYKRQLKKEQNFFQLCEIIKSNSGSIEKIRVIQHLIRISLSDRLLTDDERKFIELVAKKLVIPTHTLNALYAMHTFVTEEEIRNQKFNKPRVNYSLQKAYSILGLESTSSFSEVKDSYRDLAKIYHPDKQRGSSKGKEIAKAQFQVIAQAYKLIKSKVN